MNFKTQRSKPSSRLAVLSLVLIVATWAAYAGAPAVESGEAAVAAQDVIRIESRLTQLEQRLYSIETSLRSLEQQSRISAATTRTTRDPEVSLLRTEVDALRRRLAEVECGLLKVDERTLTAQAREARRRTEGSASDPCRLDANAPLRLPSRP